MTRHSEVGSRDFGFGKRHRERRDATNPEPLNLRLWIRIPAHNTGSEVAKACRR